MEKNYIKNRTTTINLVPDNLIKLVKILIGPLLIMFLIYRCTDPEYVKESAKYEQEKHREKLFRIQYRKFPQK